VAVRTPLSAVFLDKDGTLLVDDPYNVAPARMQLERKARFALRRLGALAVPLIVVTNQPGVALGKFKHDALLAVQRRLAELFAENGARLSGFYYCPHHPEAVVPELGIACKCRKPLPGLLRQAAADHGLGLRRSWMVGDILDDVEAGNRAGCRTILIDNGHETLWARTPATRMLRTANIVVPNLDVAARIIVSRATSPRDAIVEHVK